MNMKDFPDAPIRPGSSYPPATIENVGYLLKGAGITCRYNAIKKRVEITIPEHRGTTENLDNVSITHVVSLAAQNGMPTGLVPEYLNAIADRHAYNPAATWIDRRAWDGKDRLPAFFATVTTHEDYPVTLKQTVMHKWLRSAAAAALLPNFKGRGVLTLQGEQGLGKTSWIKALIDDPVLSEDLIKLDHHLDAGSKDSVLTAVGHWIVEIGELDSSFRRDIARLKGFLTAGSDKVRRPYDRRDSEYPRRTVFAATVNEPRFLIDATGNSRWWTIPCTALDHRHDIDMQQLLAQIAGEVRGGAEWWLSLEEEAMLTAWNERHEAVSVIEELIRERIDLDRIGEPGLKALTASETLKEMGIERPTNPQARETGAILRRIIGPPKRIQGADVWRVPFRRPDIDYRNPYGTAKPVPAAAATPNSERSSAHGSAPETTLPPEIF